MGIQKLIWTGVMLETEDGVGVAYPMGNDNDTLMQQLADHTERERVLVESLRNYRELDHATCYQDEKTGLDHRCTKCKIADLALSKVR